MEREELRSRVDENLESSQANITLSDETINGELDDALEGITDDKQVDDKFVSHLAKRLTRINGNLHQNVSTEVEKYKKAHPTPTPKPKESKGPKDGKTDEREQEEETPAWAQKLNDRLDHFEQSQKERSEKETKNAITDKVKKGLTTKFKSANVEVNSYILKQTMRDLVIPETEENEEVDTDDLVRKMEKAYYKNLKEAGLDAKNTSPRSAHSASSKGESPADKFFKRKQKEEGGWGKK